MVETIRKGELPRPEEVPQALRDAATAAFRITLREPRPVDRLLHEGRRS